LTKTPADEDEGSCLHRQVYRPWPGKSKDQRKPSGSATPRLLSLQIQTSRQGGPGDRSDNPVKSGISRLPTDTLALVGARVRVVTD